jgi:putative transposase
MGSKGDCYDNAVCESTTPRSRRSFSAGAPSAPSRTRERRFDWIEAWYNHERRHSRLGYRSPDRYERDRERSDCLREDEMSFIEEQAEAP